MGEGGGGESGAAVLSQSAPLALLDGYNTARPPVGSPVRMLIR